MNETRIEHAAEAMRLLRQLGNTQDIGFPLNTYGGDTPCVRLDEIGDALDAWFARDREMRDE